jgi:hypothetical protein
MNNTLLCLFTLLASLWIVACGGGGASGSTTGTPAPVTTGPANPTPFGVLSPTSLSFGTQNINTTSAAQNLTLSNTGTAILPINSIEISMFFAETNNCGASVAVGGSCTIQVTFDPQTVGIVAGTLEVFDNAASGAQTVTLVGPGVAGNVGTPTGTSNVNITATDGAGHTYQLPFTVTVK